MKITIYGWSIRPMAEALPIISPGRNAIYCVRGDNGGLTLARGDYRHDESFISFTPSF